MQIDLVGNFWGYLIYWIAGDAVDLFTYGPHVNTGITQYFGGLVDSPILAVWLIVGTFLDLRLFGVVALVILALTPGKVLSSFILRIMRILDRLPMVP
jgi:hypothetical protein